MNIELLRCKKCGKELAISTVMGSVRRRHNGLCRSCSMLGNSNKRGKFKQGAKYKRRQKKQS